MQQKLKVNEPTAATGVLVVPLSILAADEVTLRALFEGVVKTEGVGVLAGGRAGCGDLLTMLVLVLIVRPRKF